MTPSIKIVQSVFLERMKLMVYYRNENSEFPHGWKCKLCSEIVILCVRWKEIG